MFRDLPWSDRPPRAENASTVTSTEEGRAFFQERLAAFGLCLFVLAGVSWVLLALAYWFGRDAHLDEHGPFSAGGLLHLTNALLEQMQQTCAGVLDDFYRQLGTQFQQARQGVSHEGYRTHYHAH